MGDVDLAVRMSHRKHDSVLFALALADSIACPHVISCSGVIHALVDMWNLFKNGAVVA